MSALTIAAAPSGVCAECGCTDLAACCDPQTGFACEWANAQRSYCTVCAILAALEWQKGMPAGSARLALEEMRARSGVDDFTDGEIEEVRLSI